MGDSIQTSDDGLHALAAQCDSAASALTGTATTSVSWPQGQATAGAVSRGYTQIEYARAGDTVVVTAVDRLGRSVAEVTRTIAGRGDRGIVLRALREGIDTATPTGRTAAAVMATLAELELELGRERRASSRESRCARKLPATKPPKLSAERQEQLRRLAATGEPVRELAVAFGIGRATAYRYLSL